MCAYQVACEKHGVKVIPKLLHQLQVCNSKIVLFLVIYVFNSKQPKLSRSPDSDLLC